MNDKIADVADDSNSKTNYANQGFPYLLYFIIENESTDVISWSSSGQSFGIRNMHVFKTQTLQQYFKHDKYSSFQRQLNLYGFRKIVKGKESGCYIHCFFQRNRPDLLSEVRRGVVPPCPSQYIEKIYGYNSRAQRPSVVQSHTDSEKANNESDGTTPLPPEEPSLNSTVQSSESGMTTQSSYTDRTIVRQGSRTAKLFSRNGSNMSNQKNEDSAATNTLPRSFSSFVQKDYPFFDSMEDQTTKELKNMRESLSAMLDMFTNVHSNPTIEGNASQENYSKNMAAVPTCHSSIDNPLNFSALINEPTIGSQLIDVAYEMKERSEISNHETCMYSANSSEEDAKVVENEDDLRFSLSSVATQNDRSSLIDLVHSVEPSNSKKGPFGSIQKRTRASTTMPGGDELRSILRNSIICAIDVLNNGPKPKCVPLLHQNNCPPGRRPTISSITRGSDSKWMARYNLDSAIRDLEKSLEISPAAFDDSLLRCTSEGTDRCSMCDMCEELQTSNHRAKLRGSVYILLSILKSLEEDRITYPSKLKRLSRDLIF